MNLHDVLYYVFIGFHGFIFAEIRNFKSEFKKMKTLSNEVRYWPDKVKIIEWIRENMFQLEFLFAHGVEMSWKLRDKYTREYIAFPQNWIFPSDNKPKTGHKVSSVISVI